jgi:hypothetical protein
VNTKFVAKRVTLAAALLAAAATFGSITIGDLAVANAAMDADKFDTCMKNANYKTLDAYYDALKKCCEDSGGVYSSYFKSCSPPDDGFTRSVTALPTDGADLAPSDPGTPPLPPGRKTPLDNANLTIGAAP